MRLFFPNYRPSIDTHKNEFWGYFCQNCLEAFTAIDEHQRKRFVYQQIGQYYLNQRGKISKSRKKILQDIGLKIETDGGRKTVKIDESKINLGLDVIETAIKDANGLRNFVTSKSLFANLISLIENIERDESYQPILEDIRKSKEIQGLSQRIQKLSQQNGLLQRGLEQNEQGFNEHAEALSTLSEETKNQTTEHKKQLQRILSKSIDRDYQLEIGEMGIGGYYESKGDWQPNKNIYLSYIREENEGQGSLASGYWLLDMSFGSVKIEEKIEESELANKIKINQVNLKDVDYNKLAKAGGPVKEKLKKDLLEYLAETYLNNITIKDKGKDKQESSPSLGTRLTTALGSINQTIKHLLLTMRELLNENKQLRETNKDLVRQDVQQKNKISELEKEIEQLKAKKEPGEKKKHKSRKRRENKASNLGHQEKDHQGGQPKEILLSKEIQLSRNGEKKNSGSIKTDKAKRARPAEIEEIEEALEKQVPNKKVTQQEAPLLKTESEEGTNNNKTGNGGEVSEEIVRIDPAKEQIIIQHEGQRVTIEKNIGHSFIKFLAGRNVNEKNIHDFVNKSSNCKEIENFLKKNKNEIEQYSEIPTYKVTIQDFDSEKVSTKSQHTARDALVNSILKEYKDESDYLNVGQALITLYNCNLETMTQNEGKWFKRQLSGSDVDDCLGKIYETIGQLLVKNNNESKLELNSSN